MITFGHNEYFFQMLNDYLEKRKDEAVNER